MHIKNILLLLFSILALAGCSGSQSDNALNSSGKVTARLVGDEIQVSLANDDQQNPKIIYLSDKNLYFAVWEDWRNRNSSASDDAAKFSGADVWGKFLNPDGTSCGGEFPITGTSTNGLAGNQTLPQAAYRPGDKIVITWQDSEGTVIDGYVRYVSITAVPKYDLITSSCGTPAITISAISKVGYKNIEVYSGVNIVPVTQSKAVFASFSSANGNISFIANSTPIVPGTIKILVNNADTVAKSNFLMSDDGNGKLVGTETGTVNYNSGAIAVTSSGALKHDVWLDASFDAYVNGHVPNNETLLSRKSPKIQYDSVRDEFWFAWIESRSVNSVFSEQCWGVPIIWTVGDNNFPGYLRLKGSDLSKVTNAIGIAEADLLRNELTSTSRLLTYASTSDTITYTYEFFNSINGINTASDNTSPETLFVWEGQRNTATLKCSIDKSTGIVTSTFSTVNKDDGFVHIYGLFDKEILLGSTSSKWIDYQNKATGTNPSLAVDNTSDPRKFLIAWEDMRDGSNTKVYGQLLNSGGGLYNSNRIISFQDSAGSGTNDEVITNSRQTRPTVSYDAVNQRYFVMWQDERNSSTSSANIDLYGQFVNLDGSLSGANYSISSAPSNQLAPAIAYDPYFKRFLAVWKDARNINFPGTTASDIYGQLFSIGQPQLTLLTKTSPQLQLIPAIHDFGAVESGEWQFVVKNTGDTSLVVDKISLLPATPFTIAPTNSVTLAPGSSATYTVKFTPTSSGTYNSSFTLTSDGGNQTVSLSATGTIIAPLSITTPSATAWPNASVSSTYSIQLVAAGGYTPLTWSATGLPAGLSITSTTDSTATISGSNLALGDYNNIAVTVKDGSTPVNTSTRNYTLKVGTAISINATPLSTWTQSIDYFTAPVHSLSSTGATGSVTWMLLAGSGALPSGITLGSDGVFSGAATASGAYGFTVVATDSASQSTQSPFSITINPAPAITTTSISSGVIGFAYNQQLDMTGGTTPIVWSQTGGLPPGLQFDAVKGIISGSPTSAGSYNLSFSVKDASGFVSTKTFALTIYPVFAIATPSTGTGSPPPALVSSVYKSFTFKTNFGGASPYSWTKDSGALPAGLSLNQDTGILSGTPTAAGDYTFNLKVTDSNSAFTTKTFTISVLDASPSVNVQLFGATNASVSTYSAFPLTDLSGTPANTSPLGAAQMKIEGLASGETVSIATSFVSIPPNSVFYFVNGTQWTQFTPDSIINNTIFYKVKDRSSATDTDPLALRDSNPASGIIEGIAVVAASGTASSSTSTATGSVSSSGGGGSGCFIATAAFGSYLDPHVMVLRHFRDNVLLQSELGTSFVKFYYIHSPPIADFIAKHDILRLAMRLALTPLIFAVKYPLVFALLFITSAFIVVRRRLMKKQSEMVLQAG